MQLFPYTRVGGCFRAWPEDFSVRVGDVIFKHRPTSSEEVPWPFVASCEVEASDAESALKIGGNLCIEAANILILITGYRFDLGSPESIGRTSSHPGIMAFHAPLIYRADPASESEKDALVRQAASAHLPVPGDPQYELVLRTMRWYAQRVSETDGIDGFIKLFVILDMLVPRSRSRSGTFVGRATDTIAENFERVDRNRIAECLRDLYGVRNDLFHDGLTDDRFHAASQILDRIVRAILRRQVNLPDEFSEDELFISIASWTVKNQGGVFGWLSPPD